MPTILVAKAFGLLLSPTETPLRFEKGEHEVSEEVAGHWYVKQHLEGAAEAPEVPADFDPATSDLDEVRAYLRGSFEAQLAKLSDDELRDYAVFQRDREADPNVEEHDDGEGSETGGAGEASIGGGAGDDTLTGQASEAGAGGDDSLSGGQGGDSLTGQGSEGGSDPASSVSGGAGEDSLTGNAGDDSKTATGEGSDSLGGGAGEDAVDAKKASGRGKSKA